MAVILTNKKRKEKRRKNKKEAHHISNPRRVGTACNVLCDVIYVSYLCLVVWLFHLKKYQKNGTSVSVLQRKAAWQAGSTVKLLRNNFENAQPCSQKQHQKQQLNKQAHPMPKTSQHHPVFYVMWSAWLLWWFHLKLKKYQMSKCKRMEEASQFFQQTQ